jgi:hypothetical protein
LAIESLKNDCYDLLVRMKEDGDEAKVYSSRKRETKEKALPFLRALKTKLNRQGKKDGVDGWTAWFEENKEDLGVSLRTVDRWLDPKPEEKHKFANLDPVDGVKINSKRFLINYKFRHGRIIGITLTPFVPTEVAPKKDTAKWLPSIKSMQSKAQVAPEKSATVETQAKQKRIERAAEVRALQVAAGAVPEVLSDCPTDQTDLKGSIANQEPNQ